MNPMIILEIGRRARINSEISRWDKMNWVRILPPSTRHDAPNRMLRRKLPDFPRPNRLHLLPMLEIPDILRTNHIISIHKQVRYPRRQNGKRVEFLTLRPGVAPIGRNGQPGRYDAICQPQP